MIFTGMHVSYWGITTYSIDEIKINLSAIRAVGIWMIPGWRLIYCSCWKEFQVFPGCGCFPCIVPFVHELTVFLFCLMYYLLSVLTKCISLFLPSLILLHIWTTNDVLKSRLLNETGEIVSISTIVNNNAEATISWSQRPTETYRNTQTHTKILPNIKYIERTSK